MFCFIICLEYNAIREFKDPSVLDNASKLIFEFNRIPRLQQRMECHELAFVWGNNANTAAKDINVVNKACKELQDSKGNMEKIMSMILSIGNYINGDTARGQVSVSLHLYKAPFWWFSCMVQL